MLTPLQLLTKVLSLRSPSYKVYLPVITMDLDFFHDAEAALQAQRYISADHKYGMAIEGSPYSKYRFVEAVARECNMTISPSLRVDAISYVSCASSTVVDFIRLNPQALVIVDAGENTLDRDVFPVSIVLKDVMGVVEVDGVAIAKKASAYGSWH